MGFVVRDRATMSFHQPQLVVKSWASYLFFLSFPYFINLKTNKQNPSSD